MQRIPALCRAPLLSSWQRQQQLLPCRQGAILREICTVPAKVAAPTAVVVMPSTGAGVELQEAGWLNGCPPFNSGTLARASPISGQPCIWQTCANALVGSVQCISKQCILVVVIYEEHALRRMLLSLLCG
eukprot:1148988-Pelagomonas_calceolata.AAC.1